MVGNKTGSAARLGESPGPVPFIHEGARVEAKPFRTYKQQVEILRSRGMHIPDPQQAEEVLRTHNYYRLAGYWHSMRSQDPRTGQSLDTFRDGASFDLVLALYDFDARLRDAVFTSLAPIELTLRALIGYHLGQIDPLIHLDISKLGATARSQTDPAEPSREYRTWLKKFTAAVEASREDFVEHHRSRYDSLLPIWVAVEVMDWGALSYLYKFSPNPVRNRVARQCSMSAPQLESWLKTLNILRNYAAHHARLFTRVFDIKPKRIQDPRMSEANKVSHLLFGQLSMIRYLYDALDIRTHSDALARVIESYPHNDLVPLRRTGTPDNWRDLPLWAGE